MDLNAVATFVAVADAGQFQEAAAELSVTQQAVSKRVAALENSLGVKLFARVPSGARLTIDGQAFLPHARALLDAAERAAASVRPGSRALRVDVVHRQVATAGLLRAFHRTHSDTALDIVTLHAGAEAVEAVRSGAIDATIRAVALLDRPLPEGVESVPVLDEPLHLFTGPRHPFAEARSITPAQLAGHRIWMPGNVPGTEWTAYYDLLAAEFGFTIDTIGPDFGIEALFDTIAGSSTAATFVGEETPLAWPAGHALRRIPLVDPTPVYPGELVWRTDNAHPALTALRDHLTARYPGRPGNGVWTPEPTRAADAAIR
ncbi:DNA-binding transcriptional regulator, LysR family [Actinomadura meyerae]|uniref:DNA-binding transcriptional regulator, LysR family n=1 Tax=Actinomadura meyerae TaxID=240840 RepID=A0A239F2Y3_9ACTN|nr:LysR family transcriptional regulator [Actinomadura meyerae]SNS50464.1 DNA-binding transcriptional regulator, LysR family [Actinomadura meyerae]